MKNAQKYKSMCPIACEAHALYDACDVAITSHRQLWELRIKFREQPIAVTDNNFVNQ